MRGPTIVSIAVLACGMLFARLSVATQDKPATRERASQDIAMVEQAYAERHGPQAEMWRDRIKAAERDLDESLDWLLQNSEGERALRFADAMNFFWTSFGEAQKSRDRLTQVLAMPTASRGTAVRAKVLIDAGLLAFRQGDQAAARALNEESFAIGQRLGDKSAMASALVNLSRVGLRDHDYGAVRRYAEQGTKLSEELGDPSGERSAIHMLAAAARMEGDDAGAAKFYELTLGMAGEAGNKLGVAGELYNLGYVHLHQHDVEWAARLFKESVSMYRALQDQPGLAWNISGFAAVAAERHEAARAARLYGAFDAAMSKLAIVPDPDDQLDLDRYSDLAKRQVDGQAFDAARAEGRRLSIDTAIEMALGRP